MLTSNEPLPNLLFEYRGADIILRSRDLHHFQVPKVYIVNCSPVLDESIQNTLDRPHDVHDEASLPVMQLPESGAILHNLLTYIFPVTPLVPSTAENFMELLSVAQKYQMDSVLGHIRLSIARHIPPSTQRDSALRMYALAQRYGLHQEALQAARTVSNFPMSIEDLEEKLDMMSGASFYELWKYFGRVQAILVSDLTEFRSSGAGSTFTSLRCVEFTPSQIPRWLDDYIESIGGDISLFDFIEFNSALACHMEAESSNPKCACVFIPSQTIREFWDALSSVVNGSFEKAESALSLVQEREVSQSRVNSTTSLPEPFEVPDANLIIRSSDLVHFRVHKSVLVMASPFFKDLLSLPQPSDSESVDGLPVVQVSEDAELLTSLISMLYPAHPVIPNSYEKVLYLLEACQKFDMGQVQASICAEVNRGGFPAPMGTEVFRAYAIARSKRLIPETENAARLTLDYPMTFETLGEGLRLFEDSALHDLACFRRRCRDGLVTCLKSFLEVNAQGPSSIWVGCPSAIRKVSPGESPQAPPLPSWLYQLLSRTHDDLFTDSLTTSSNIREEYLVAIQTHTDCHFCLRVHTTKGATFCTDLESKLAEARDKVRGYSGYLASNLTQVIGIGDTFVVALAPP